MLPLTFVPYGEVGETPNVVVDGSAAPSTCLVLSHWPGSPTPDEVADDLSAQIAFRALGHPDWFAAIDAVSNNHFDQDGLVSAFVLVDPPAALARRDRLIDVASAGDFGTFDQRDSARVAMALAAWSDPERSPLGAEWFAGHPDATGALYLELLPRLVELVDDPGTARELWAEEDARLGASIDALVSGTVSLVERPDLDLAIVTLPESLPSVPATRFTETWSSALHPMAVNNATGCFRVLLVQGRRYHLELRYESWVMYRSRRVLPRPDLRPLADRLNEMEPDGAVWTAGPPGGLAPTLHMGAAESGLEPAAFVAELEAYLRSAPPAWDPFEPR